MNFRVTVEGVKDETGHPISRLEGFLDVATKMAEELSKKYPFNDIIIFETVECEAYRIKGKEKETKAPTCKQCGSTPEKIVNGRSVIVRGSKLWHCTICGWTSPF